MNHQIAANLLSQIVVVILFCKNLSYTGYLSLHIEFYVKINYEVQKQQI